MPKTRKCIGTPAFARTLIRERRRKSSVVFLPARGFLCRFWAPLALEMSPNLRCSGGYNQSSMPTTVRSHAKINLGLGIGAPRADGFHSLVTAYQTLEMHDIVTVTARNTWKEKTRNIRITSNDERVPADSRNTAWKMMELALQDGGSYAEVEIHIEKRLPIQGGLGAGSANAVAALLGLERELGWNRPRRELGWTAESPWKEMGIGTWYWPARRLEIAARVGSDVPLFLVGGTVLGVDRGQEVYPLPDLDSTWCVVAVPETGVSTPQAFRDWDALCAQEGLTPEASDDKLRELSHAYASAFGIKNPEDGLKAGSSGVISKENEFCRNDLAGPQESALVRTGITSWIENDFEQVVFRQHPSLREIKRILAAQGTPEAALYASLSGSGSALFGLYQTRGDAEAAQNRLGKQSEELKVRSINLTRTLPRAEYWCNLLS
jgi:4-diphosphocytidyl-2-C-methyl-D-erythritol kinase